MRIALASTLVLVAIAVALPSLHRREAITRDVVVAASAPTAPGIAPALNVPPPLVVTPPAAPRPKVHPPRRIFRDSDPLNADTFDPWDGTDIAPVLAAIPRARIDATDPWDPSITYPPREVQPLTDDRPWAMHAVPERGMKLAKRDE